MSRIAQVLFLFALSLLGPGHATAQMAGHNHEPQPPQAGEPLIVGDQVTSIPYFTLRDGLSSQLTLFNSAPTPTPVTLTIYNPEGRSYSPPAIVVDGHTYKVVQLKEVVPNRDFDSGSIEIAFRGINIMAVTVQVSIYSIERRVLVESRHLHMFMSSNLNGIVWLPGEADGYLAITNAGTSRRTVQWTVGGKKNEMVLFGHQSRLVKLNDEDRRTAAPRLISLHHDGLPGDIVAGGFVLDLKRGYSATIPMADPAVMRSSKLSGAHVRLGEPNAREGFPKNTRFSAPLLLGNTGDKPSNVSVSLTYSVSGPKDAPDKVSTVSVKRVTVRPGDVERVELSKELTGLPSASEIKATGIDIVYDTAPGSIISQLTNVDETGDYSFEVPFRDASAMDKMMEGGYPWTIENDKNTTIYLKNTTDKSVQASSVFIFPDGGMYHPLPVDLQPYQTFAIDVRKLKNTKDWQGNAFPADATRGQFVWRQETPYSMLGRAETVSLKDGIASSFTCETGCCNVESEERYFEPDYYVGSVGETIPITGKRNWWTCFGQNFDDPFSPSYWQSSNTNVAYNNGSGVAVLVGAGDITISAQYTKTNYWWNGWCQSQQETLQMQAQATSCNFTIQPATGTWPADYCNVLTNNQVIFQANVTGGCAVVPSQSSCSDGDTGNVHVDPDTNVTYKNINEQVTQCVTSFTAFGNGTVGTLVQEMSLRFYGATSNLAKQVTLTVTCP